MKAQHKVDFKTSNFADICWNSGQNCATTIQERKRSQWRWARNVRPLDSLWEEDRQRWWSWHWGECYRGCNWQSALCSQRPGPWFSHHCSGSDLEPASLDQEKQEVVKTTKQPIHNYLKLRWTQQLWWQTTAVLYLQQYIKKKKQWIFLMEEPLKKWRSR